MTIYTATFRTDASYATREFKADTPALALEQARAMLEDEEFDGLFFDHYDGPFPINEITIGTEDTDDLAVWCDEDLRLRLAARDLLRAARLVVARWERGNLAAAVRKLSAAIAKAEGGAS